MVKRAIKALDGQFCNLTTSVNVAQLCLLHICSGDEVLLTNWTNVMGDFTCVAEEHLRSSLEARLRENVQVRAIAEQVIPNDLIIRRTG